jgi:hypothetical protein
VLGLGRLCAPAFILGGWVGTFCLILRGVRAEKALDRLGGNRASFGRMRAPDVSFPDAL